MASRQLVPCWDIIDKLCACLGSLCFCSHRQPFCALLVPQCVTLYPHSSFPSPYRVTSS